MIIAEKLNYNQASRMCIQQANKSQQHDKANDIISEKGILDHYLCDTIEQSLITIDRLLSKKFSRKK